MQKLSGASGSQKMVALFVGGMSRAGTTLLAELLTSRPEVALMIEYDLLEFLRDQKAIFKYHHLVNPNGPAAHSCPPLPATSNTTPHLRQNLSAIYRRRYPSPDRLQQITLAVLRAALDKPDATIIGCKAPYFYVNHDDRSLSDFDDVRYIFLIRRPYGQISSSLNRGKLTQLSMDDWPIQNIEAAIEEYEHSLNVAISFALEKSRTCLFVKYEDLIDRPAIELTRIGTFLGIPDLSDTESLVGPETTKSALSAQEETYILDRMGALENAWPTISTHDRAGLASKLSLGLPKIIAEEVSYVGSNTKRFLGAGWSIVEPDGIWTAAERADIIFTGVGDWIITASVIPYMPHSNSVIRVDTYWNGDWIGQVQFQNSPEVSKPHEATTIILMNGHPLHTLTFGPLAFLHEKPNILSFAISGAVPPSDSGFSADNRLVGIKLQTLKFMRS